MPLAITITQGHQVDDNPVGSGDLNKLGSPTAAVTGEASTSQIGDHQVTKAKVEFGDFFGGTDTGSANAHSVTIDSDLTAWPTESFDLFYEANAANTAAVTVAVTATGGAWTGTKAIKKLSDHALEAGDIRSGQLVHLRYNPTGGNFELMNPLGNRPVVYAATTNSVTDAYLLDDSPTNEAVVTALRAGQVFWFKANHTNTGAATMDVSGLGAVALKKNGTAALAADDLVQDRMYAGVYDGTNIQIIAGLEIPTIPAVVAVTRNLKIVNTSGNATTRVDITADEVMLTNSSGSPLKASSVNVTANIAASGANGLDTGTEASSTFYYIWLISDGSTTASLLSASASSPTLPSGYTYKALVGFVRNDSSGDFVNVLWRDRRWSIDPTDVFTGKAAAAGDTWEALAGADLTAFQGIVPSIATGVRGVMGDDTGTVPGRWAVAATSNGMGMTMHIAYNNNGSAQLGSFTDGGNWFVDLLEHNLYWKRYNTTAGARLTITGGEW